MYLEYYNLKEKPFSLTPDPAFIYYSTAHRRAISFLRYGLQESKGFLQLTGPVGSGKTTLLRAVLDQLHEKTKTAYIINPCASFPDLLRAIMKDLEISNIPPTSSKLELLDFFHDYLLVQLRRNSPVILIFDESQNLSLKNLEEIRMLSNFETSKEKLLQIVFVGQPEFVKTIDLPELRQLKQRIQVRYHLSPLRFHEVKEYINHRLQVAGSTGKIIFTDEACSSIFTFSDGIPRLINAVCDVVLLIGYVSEQYHFGKDAVDEAIQELNGHFDENDEQVRQIEEPRDRDQPPVLPTQTVPPANTNSPTHRKLTENASPENMGTVPTEANTNGEKGTHEGILSQSATGRTWTSASRAMTQEHGAATDVPIEPDNACAANGKRLIPLHSFLRHRSTKKFHLGGAGLLILDVNEYSRVYDRDFFSGHIIGQRGSSMNTPPQDGSDEPSLFGPTPHQTEEHSCSDNGTGETKSTGKTAAVSPETPTDTATASLPAKGPEFQPFRLTKILSSLFKKQQHEMKPALMNGKAIIVYKNGAIARGTVEELALEKSGFQFSPLSPNGVLRKKFVLFHQICAVYIVEDFSLELATETTVPYNPKLRQIVVVLLNGDVLDGMMLDQESFDSPRFYIILSKGKRSCWALIEKSGTLGILSEKYRDGIYAEKLEPLGSSNLLFSDDPLDISTDEVSADAYFACNEFQMALCKYRRLIHANPQSERLAAKVSLCYHNFGIQLVHMRKYGQAKEAFEKISNFHLRERVSTVMEGLDTLTGKGSTGTTLDGRLKEGFQCRKLSVH